MIVIEDYNQNTIVKLSANQLIAALEEIKAMKQKEVELLKEKIKQYEQKRRSHEVWYQSLSPVRKFFTGRPPAHHQAVEYLVNVKERFQHIEQINQKVFVLTGFIQRIETDQELERVSLANDILDDLKKWLAKGGIKVDH